jgi:hypothetical protein
LVEHHVANVNVVGSSPIIRFLIFLQGDHVSAYLTRIVSVYDFRPAFFLGSIKMKVGDLIVVKPNRLDDYKMLLSLGLIDEVGIITQMKENNLCEVFVRSQTVIIPKVYLIRIEKEKPIKEVCESCECTPCDCDWGLMEIK